MKLRKLILFLFFCELCLKRNYFRHQFMPLSCIFEHCHWKSLFGICSQHTQNIGFSFSVKSGNKSITKTKSNGCKVENSLSALNTWSLRCLMKLHRKILQIGENWNSWCKEPKFGELAAVNRLIKNAQESQIFLIQDDEQVFLTLCILMVSSEYGVYRIEWCSLVLSRLEK